MSAHVVLEGMRALSDRFAGQRAERQRRRELDPADFEALRAAGFLRTGLPLSEGGLWEGAARSVRPVCDMLRILAHGDSSVALVASMHPSVLLVGGWTQAPEAPEPYSAAWREQRRFVLESVKAGAWWGTITSEPGSGGDRGKTRATAHPVPGGRFRLSGEKHFGSGSGITRFMITTAVPAGEQGPDLFILEMGDLPWDGSAGVTLAAPWDGHGMTATQSHAFRFTHFPAIRSAWPDPRGPAQAADSASVACIFTAVIVGVVEIALETARQQLQRRASLRPYEQVEWVRVEQEEWLIQQAYEGMLRSVESGENGAGVALTALRGKTAIAELAESALQRLCRVLGGGTFSRHTPFGYWFEDVRALGFLRPPWGLVWDGLIQASFPGKA